MAEEIRAIIIGLGTLAVGFVIGVLLHKRVNQ